MKVRICGGTKCMFYGASNILDRVTDLKESLSDYPGIPEEAVLDVEIIPCDGSCKGKDAKISPVVYIDDQRLECATSPQVMELILNGLQEEK
ncbi:MAG: NAD(P)H-dependent oxidoreductase subunit E [Peptoniphilaceae bacterium]|nr:NAD(P)H-dependent oxidoreductase subunit E [Peptoniphilaceae bacterium]MCI6660643.1 NAD(P)H-dependent oxidoreductase subunit E [Peptoniphilaceae bacterium]MDD7433787.1 NAD(P)H-dependent oxidoreductase subunit E [Peptoniphilaceae bacterium]MDY3075949.1 NAD(P)H-dependent oxidoreductase subunit E [Peptoniphilaceae bacterium]MDY3987647.1 NAD(P)H-dependent oxidoreductase subunit E [Peptoniphilaceae bacterium]